MRKNGKRKILDKDDKILYIVLMAWPILQFAIFYICVNFNSILLSFEKIDMAASPAKTYFSLGYFVDNLKTFFSRVNIVGDEFGKMLSTSLAACGISIVVSIPLQLLFSYYIGRKFIGSGFFRVLLFMPSIISTIVITPLFKYFVSDALPVMLSDWFGIKMSGDLLYNANTIFPTIMFFNIWLGFGTSVLMYSNVVGEISPETIDAAKIDGASPLREFLHVVMPAVYPTMTVFVVTTVAGVFTNQIGLLDFYGTNSSVTTIGYVLYVMTETSSANLADYPSLSAFAVLLTIVTIPLTLLVKYLMEKFGPSED